MRDSATSRIAVELGGVRGNVGDDLGGRRPTCTDSEILVAVGLIEAGEVAIQVARDFGMFRATLCRRIRELPQPRI